MFYPSSKFETAKYKNSSNHKFYGSRFVYAHAALFFPQTRLQKMRVRPKQFMFEGWFGVFQTDRKSACAELFFINQINGRLQIKKRVIYKPSSEDLVDKGDFCTKQHRIYI
jgi:hypothetical protein